MRLVQLTILAITLLIAVRIISEYSPFVLKQSSEHEPYAAHSTPYVQHLVKHPFSSQAKPKPTHAIKTEQDEDSLTYYQHETSAAKSTKKHNPKWEYGDGYDSDSDEYAALDDMHPQWWSSASNYGGGGGYRRDDAYDRDYYVKTKNEYEIPLQYVAARRDYHRNISVRLLDPQIVKPTYKLKNYALCQVLGNEVAIVGNGPLNQTELDAIDDMSCIIRFNTPNNKSIDRRTDIWVVRSNDRPPNYFWGLNTSWPFHTTMLKKVKMVAFLGGTEEQVKNATLTIPLLKKKKSVHYETAKYERVYGDLFGVRRGVGTMPSSGFMGILAVLACHNPGMKVHLWGFNWSDHNYIAHVMYAEAYLIQLLQKDYNIVIHQTQCMALRGCESPSPQPLYGARQFNVAYRGKDVPVRR